MRINIREVLGLRSGMVVEGARDELVEYLAIEAEKLDEFAYPAVGSFSARRRKMMDKALCGRFRITGLLDLGVCYTGTNVRTTLVLYERESKSKRRIVKISNWTGTSFDPKRDGRDCGSRDVCFGMPESFEGEFLEYINTLEAWVAGGACPKDSEHCEFVELSEAGLDPEHLTPRHYNARARSIRKALKKEKTIPLEELADLIFPQHRSMYEGELAKVICPGDKPSYPLDCLQLSERPNTGVRLEKGDLLIPVFFSGEPYLVLDEPAEDVFVGWQYCVVRNAKVPASYLRMFFEASVVCVTRG